VSGVKGKRRKRALEKQIQFANTLTEIKLKSKRVVQCAERPQLPGGRRVDEQPVPAFAQV